MQTKIEKLILLLIVLVFQSFSIKANSDTSIIRKARIDKYYFKSYFSDCKDVAISPFYWNKNKIITTSGIITLSVLCYTQDKSIMNFFQKNRTENIDVISKTVIEPFGSGKYSIPIISLVYFYGLINKNERSKKVTLLAIKSAAISSLTTTLIKYSFHRWRPYECCEPNAKRFDGPSLKNEHISFISGHTVFIFSVATIFASEYKDVKAIPVIAYSIAGLSALSRIYDNKHWASDVVVGAAIGFGISKLIYNKNNWKIELLPYSNRSTSGLSAIMKI